MKLVTAKVLENTNRLLNEAFDASQGTQRSDLGLYKKFALLKWGAIHSNVIGKIILYGYVYLTTNLSTRYISKTIVLKSHWIQRNANKVVVYVGQLWAKPRNGKAQRLSKV